MKVVLTAAIMDVFHTGHKNLLEKMRESGERVVVVLHDDMSCWKIKGKIPIQTLRHRKRNLLLTGLADEVLVTRHTDPSDQFEKVILEHGWENILFMRGDDNKDFPGKWMIDSFNIPIKYVRYTPEISSSFVRTVLDLGEN